MSNARTQVDLGRIRRNAESIRARVGVPIIGVVKADAYGLGAVTVADAIADLVDAWYVFRPVEAVQSRLYELTGKPTIATVVDDDDDLDLLTEHRVRPAAWTVAQARRFAPLDPVLAVDTGMQRFACPPEQLDVLLAAHTFSEAFTHASKPAQAHQLKSSMAGRVPRLHAAASALLDDPSCWLDAVRPGAALYAGAARVSATIVDARDERGPVGYTGFASPTGRHGVIVRGYARGMRRGPCMVNGRPQRILEVGMQSSYVSLDAADRAGDEVVLLGEGVPAHDVAHAWGCSAHEVLVTLAGLGERSFVGN